MLHLSLTVLDLWHKLKTYNASDKALYLNPKEVDIGGHMPDNQQNKKGKMTANEAGYKGSAKGGERVRRLILEGEQLERDWL